MINNMFTVYFFVSLIASCGATYLVFKLIVEKYFSNYKGRVLRFYQMVCNWIIFYVLFYVLLMLPYLLVNLVVSKLLGNI